MALATVVIDWECYLSRLRGNAILMQSRRFATRDMKERASNVP